MHRESKVVVVKADAYEDKVLSGAFAELWSEMGGLEAIINPGDKVLIKPNLVEGIAPDRAVTTHPEVLRYTIRTVKNIGGIAYVGDSPGLENAEKAAKKAGFLAVCEEEGAVWLNFAQEEEFLCQRNDGSLAKIKLFAQIKQFDKVVSLAKMKTHSFMITTGATKNLFGLVVGTNKAQYHLKMQDRMSFSQLILDIAQLVAPCLSIVDGIVGMEGQGPRNGNPKQAGVLIAGKNCLEVDAVMASIMGISEAEIPLLERAGAIGAYDGLENINIRGSGNKIRLNFVLPHSMYNSLSDMLPTAVLAYLRKKLTALPLIKKTCAYCGKCKEICPAKAIKENNGHFAVDEKNCIRCYCCQEFCPHNAITFKRSKLLKLYEWWYKRRLSN